MKKQLLSFVLVAGMASSFSLAQTLYQTPEPASEQQAASSASLTAGQSPLSASKLHTATWQAASIAQAQQTLLTSKLTGRTYRIQVMAVGDAPDTGYMPVYVLDGDMMFPTAATAAYT